MKHPTHPAKTKRRMRSVSKIRQPRVDPKLDSVAQELLDRAESLWQTARGLDTAVGDIMAEGIARIVHCAYDTRAIAQCISDFDHVNYIQAKTYEWFRERGFVEWFCAGASTLFMTSPRNFFRVRQTKARSGKAVVFTREKVG